jgi:hypothetical protein
MTEAAVATELPETKQPNEEAVGDNQTAGAERTKAHEKGSEPERDPEEGLNVVAPEPEPPRPGNTDRSQDGQDRATEPEGQKASSDPSQDLDPEEQQRKQLAKEAEKQRREAILEQVHTRFLVAGMAYSFKDQPDKVAFKDKGDRMVTSTNDDRVAKAMAELSEAKGWSAIHVKGHKDFRKQVWLEASLRGINVNGYKPTDQDRMLLEARRERAMLNQVEKDQGRGIDRESERGKGSPEKHLDREAGEIKRNGHGYHEGVVLDHGEANYKHDPQENASYYIKLQTEMGERTVWGVDLRRVMAENHVKAGERIILEKKGEKDVVVTANVRDNENRIIDKEMITTNRNAWDVKLPDRPIEKVIEQDQGLVRNPQAQAKNDLEKSVPNEKTDRSHEASHPQDQPLKATDSEKKRDGNRYHEGVVLDFGEDNYKHRPDEKTSYFVKLQTEKGERTVWGVDLQRVMDEHNVKVGERVILEKKGEKAVLVESNVRDDENRVIDKEIITTNRNSWDVKLLDRPHERTVEPEKEWVRSVAPQASKDEEKQSQREKSDRPYIKAVEEEKGSDRSHHAKGSRDVAKKAPRERDVSWVPNRGNGSYSSEKMRDLLEGVDSRSGYEDDLHERRKVVEAFASAVIDHKVRDWNTREILKAAVGESLSERERSGSIPSIPIYDKQAPSLIQQPVLQGPTLEKQQGMERTR